MQRGSLQDIAAVGQCGQTTPQPPLQCDEARRLSVPSPMRHRSGTTHAALCCHAPTPAGHDHDAPLKSPSHDAPVMSPLLPVA